MKIYKLLILLLVFAGLHSCTEYIDNGMKDSGYEQAETPVFKAGLVNQEDFYVGDTIVFEAKFNNVDVTSTTIFKVNGVELKRDYNPKNGYIYIAKAIGKHNVVATLDSFTYSFDFEVLEEEEEPVEPTGNRIEYGGKSYPVSQTVWMLFTDGNDAAVFTQGGVDYGVWIMASSEFDSNEEIVNHFETTVAVPLNAGKVVLPYGDQAGMIYMDEGVVYIEGNEVFEITNVNYVFAGTGNTPPQQVGQNFVGTSNYTGLGTGSSSGNSAELFWNGQYYFLTQDVNAPKAKGPKKFNKSNLLNKNQMMNLGFIK